MPLTLTQADVTGALVREWRNLREADALASILPSMRTWQWMADEGARGYATRDYTVGPVPPALARFGSGSGVGPCLLEKYWSVRTVNGPQSSSWQPSLNLHVVTIRRGAVGMADLAHASELATALRHAAWSGREAGFAQDRVPTPGIDTPRANLYVRALVLGESSGLDVRRMAWDAWDRPIPLLVADYSYSVADGFRFVPLEDDSLSTAIYREPQVLSDVGDELLGHDELPQTGWRWRGVNDGPVYDAATRLTVHNGRVL
ncbi:MAG TPA: hypothetical protein VE869_05270 [Gemmatimonas sp.]|nr:hypothetical protein [Gemmatimonas sp.]